MLEFNVDSISACDLPIEDGQVLLLLPQGCESLSDSDYDDMVGRFSDIGFELVYLPKLIESLPESLVEYFVPEQNGRAPSSYDVVQNRILGELGLSVNSPTAVIPDYGELRGLVTEEGDEDTREFLEQLLEYLLGEGSIPIGSIPECSPCEMMEENACLDVCDECAAPSIPRPCIGASAESPGGAISEEFCIEQLIEELRSSNEGQLRSLGLSEAALRFILGHVTPKFSRMTITRHSRIILDDYSGREIKLDDKTKALYFLYLRHPEGIAIKDLPEHRNELMDLYQSISGRDDPDAMRKTIENLSDPFQNNANISLSRIKKAFCEAFTQSLASKYYVDGERGGLRRISLDRSLVTFEAIR